MKRSGFKKKTLKEVREKQVAKRKLQRSKLALKKSIKEKKKRERKIKYQSISTLEKRVWELCKQIKRAECIKRYTKLKCYTCYKPITNLSDAHTGHWRKKSTLSVVHKYDLRVLQIQCSGCNIYLDGNEAEYTLHLIRDFGERYVLDLADQLRLAKNRLIGGADARMFLQELEEKYKIILKSYQHN